MTHSIVSHNKPVWVSSWSGLADTNQPNPLLYPFHLNYFVMGGICLSDRIQRALRRWEFPSVVLKASVTVAKTTKNPNCDAAA